MDNLDTRRLEHASQSLEKGRAALSSDPKMGLYWVKSGLQLRATTLTKLGSPQAEEAVRELVSESTKMHSELGLPVSVNEQNDLVILSLSLRNVALARQIAGLPDTGDEYPFNQVMKGLLAQALGLAAEHPKVRPADLSAAEQSLAADIAAIIEGKQGSLEGVDDFWSSTRKKRYANTIHEYRNFFKAALQALQSS